MWAMGLRACSLYLAAASEFASAASFLLAGPGPSTEPYWMPPLRDPAVAACSATAVCVDRSMYVDDAKSSVVCGGCAWSLVSAGALIMVSAQGVSLSRGSRVDGVGGGPA